MLLQHIKLYNQQLDLAEKWTTHYKKCTASKSQVTYVWIKSGCSKIHPPNAENNTWYDSFFHYSPNVSSSFLKVWVIRMWNTNSSGFVHAAPPELPYTTVPAAPALGKSKCMWTRRQPPILILPWPGVAAAVAQLPGRQGSLLYLQVL